MTSSPSSQNAESGHRFIRHNRLGGSVPDVICHGLLNLLHKCSHGLRLSVGHQFHTAIVQVPHNARDRVPARDPPRCFTEAHALDLSRKQITLSHRSYDTDMPVWTNIPGGIGGQFGTWKTRASAFPRWGVSLLLIAALPGVLVAAAGALLLGISIFVVLLFVIPVYRIILLISPRPKTSATDVVDETYAPSPGSKPVTVRILE